MDPKLSSPPHFEPLWSVAQRSGISRRQFIKLLSIGGAGAVLAACLPNSESATGEEIANFVKDTAPLNELGGNLETRLEDLKGWLTPQSQFFVRNHTPTPIVDVESYVLRVEGDAVAKPLELTFDELLKLPSHTVLSYLECAGNQRSLFERVLGQEASGGQWTLGGVSMGTWSGVSLQEILLLAGVSESAVAVNIKGLDMEAAEGGFNRPIPIDKAMDPDTLLAYAMNGDVLPPDHGFPLRAIVPGYVASNSIKWVGTIMVSSEPIWVKNNTTSYVLVGEDWPAEDHAPADGGPISLQNIKSSRLM